MRTVKSTAFGIALAVLLVGSSAWATVLTFDSTPQFASTKTFQDNAYDSVGDYGDRVDATFQTAVHHQDGGGGYPPTYSWDATYLYGSAGGATPNVVVSYASPGAPGTPRYYAGSSDGTGAVYFEQSGGNSPDVLMDFIADSGFLASLDGLDMVNWGAVSIKTLKVLDAASTVLWDSGATAAAPIAMANGEVQHYNIGLSGAYLRLIMAENGTSTNLGVDNIQFSQVPEPATLALLILGGMGLLRRRR